MNKKEAFDYIRKRNGYIPYIGLFEIFNDDDEIPQELINMSCRKHIPNNYFIICNPTIYEHLKNLKNELDRCK